MNSGVSLSHKRGFEASSLDMGGVEYAINWDDVICPICLDFPHNGVLLHCSSYEKGCRPFICDTDHTHSNCLDRFKTAYGLPASSKISSTADRELVESIQAITSDQSVRPTCPLCRGDVTGWVVVDEARVHLNMKKRCCEEKNCAYVGNYLDLQKHANIKHPNARPAEIDPVRILDWDNFQQSSEIIDVLSTIHSEVPRGVVLGDYVIEYGDDDTGDEYEDFPGDEGNWWTSCILYHVFDNFRASRNRRRSRRARRRSSYDAPSTDEGSTSSVDITDFRFDETDDEFVGAGGAAAASRGSSTHHRVITSFVNSMEEQIARGVMMFSPAKKIWDTLKNTYRHEKNISM